MTARRRLLMIGLDAGDKAFIEAHLSSLPNIARFFAGGGIRDLRVDPLAGAVWCTFITQSTPDAHGVYHHLQWNRARMRMERTHPSWVGEITPFWRRLAADGKRVAVLDAPFVFRGAPGDAPADAAFEVCNWGSHDLVDRFWCTDKAEERRISSTYGVHPMGFEVPVDKTRAQLEKMIDDIVKGAGVKADLTVDLMNRRPWDLFITVFGETHRAGHMLWVDDGETDAPAPPDGLLRVYQAVDAAVGRVAAAAPEDSEIMLFSLHGMGPNQCQSHLSRDMLMRALSAAGDAPEATAAPAAKEKFGLFRVLRKSIPARLQHAIAEMVPIPVRDFVIAREIAGGVDWSATPAISLNGDLSGYWRFNVAGREAKGCLPADGYDAFCAYLAKTFSEFTDEHGRKLVKEMHFPARDGRGARAAFLPDLVAEWDPALPAAQKAVHPVLGEISARLATGRGGNHRFNGFYGFLGESPAGVPRPAHISELGALATALV